MALILKKYNKNLYMKIFFLTGLLAISFASYSQTSKDGFIIKGKVPGMTTGKIYLSAFILDGKTDSALIQNGSFSFSGSVKEPTPYILCFERNYFNKPLLNFFVEKGPMQIVVNADDIRKSKVAGSVLWKEFADYQKRVQPYNDLIGPLAARRKIIAEDDKVTMDSIIAAWADAAAKKKEVEKAFIKANPKSIISAYIITRSFISQPDLVALESMYNGLSPAVQTSSYAQKIKERLEKGKLSAVGQLAHEFTQADTLGKMVSLKDFRGKYVLLDFWASWCAPCRAENPNVVKAFNAYKNKGFTVLGVSLDRPGKKQDWLDAIHKDDLAWTHVSDLKFWDNEVSRLYGINAVPSNFLIDPAGKIIARNLEGKELFEKLNEVLK